MLRKCCKFLATFSLIMLISVMLIKKGVVKLSVLFRVFLA